MTLGTFTDERTDVIGASFDIDGAKFDALCAMASLSPLVKIDLQLIDATEDAPPHGAVRSKDDDSDEWELVLPVSDRMEFSDKSVMRVNRNLLHTLRHIAQMLNIRTFFPDTDLANGAMMLSGPVLEEDAYRCEKTIKELPKACCLTPKQIALAPDPVLGDPK